MHDNFKNWKLPKFNKSGMTRWNWMCQYSENLKLGKNTDIGAFTYINANFGVDIEDYVEIGSGCSIYSNNTIDEITGKVIIKKNAKIGTHCTIMPGVTIGENAVIGAYSFVKNNIPANSVAYGVPAKVIKKAAVSDGKIQIAKPYIDDEDKKAVMDVLESGWLSLGPKYKEFEQNMASYVGTKYACAVSSGTSGLHLAVIALGLKEGDEVITTPFSFVASSNCLLYEKVKPVFVDIEEETFNLDPDKIESAITKKTKAILVVHIFGQSARMDKIMKIARKYKLKVIEDSCESLGARFQDKMTGTFGDIGVYSFYPNKQMTTGEGAVIVTNSKRLYELCDSLRNQGRGLRESKKGKDWDWLMSERLGYNYRMDEMSAALGITQLKKIDSMIEKRRRIVGLYKKHLEDIKNLIIPTVGKDRTHTWFVYVIQVINGKRDQLMSDLSSAGIQVRPYLPAIHLQKFMKKMFGFKKGDFPVCEKISSQTLAIPFYIGLDEDNIKYIAARIRKILK
ncbi:MAG: aminotransferase class V-fold PLP-dependent enzyme [Candidatus Daviesbacteria bacterium]|nr:aminotransferase class V-fold PLP-dependent enzyme [Candidatus Daviesbacteria bacterium]